MSHQKNIEVDEFLNETFCLDQAPHYRQDIFGSVYPTTALERKKNRIKEFNKTWGVGQMNDAMDKFREVVGEAQESSEERNEAVKKVFDSLARV
jgi:hypothetical protein